MLLSWWGTADASSYRVQRGASASGPFTTVATITDPRTFSDAPGDGIWYYTVTAISDSGESSASNVVRVALLTESRVLLPLNSASGTTAADTSGHGQDGTLAGDASWGAGRNGGNALALDGSSGRLVLPQGVLSDLGDFTYSGALSAGDIAALATA